MNSNIDSFQLNNKIYSNNNNILLGIINDLNQIINYSKDNIIIKRLSDIIIKMNFIINENRKNTELIRNDISNILNQMNKRFDELNINNNNTFNNQEIRSNIGRYVGQVVNGKAEGKGIEYYNNGDRYEGDFRNGTREGKGIYYYNDGDRYEGDFRNDKKEGKGIDYYNNGNRYEGDFRNDKREGKGIKYYNNGDIYEGDYRNNKREIKNYKEDER